jgi:hypothetical protein
VVPEVVTVQLKLVKEVVTVVEFKVQVPEPNDAARVENPTDALA